MNKILKVVFISFIFLNFFFSSWYVLNSDINFSSDIGRDFLLFQEIDQKKIVLIGPRSSVSGLFHGPLWLYVNYPAYLIGQGNPIIVGWGWVFFTICFTIASFFIAKKLFDEITGYLFALMVSAYMFFHSHSLINPHGALFLLPAFFFFFIRYLQKGKFWYLLIHALIGGFMIQFEMAVGIPFVILSFLAVTARVIKQKKIMHIFAFFLTFLTLSNYIIFDIRHQFLISQTVVKYLTTYTGPSDANIFITLLDRLKLLVSGVEILRLDPGYRNLMLFTVLIILLALQIKHKKHRLIYFSFLYFYFGFSVLSLINKGPILYFYFYPLFPLVFLIFSSFATSRYKKWFIPFFVLIYVMNFQTIISGIDESKEIIDKDLRSWKFLNKVASDAYKGSEKEFGYLIFTPDGLAYAPRYAMIYNEKVFHKKSYSFEKKAVTYVLAEPSPENLYMKPEWWIENKAIIKKTPSSIKTYSNGYELRKYNLSKEEIEVPIAEGTDLGLHFR